MKAYFKNPDKSLKFIGHFKQKVYESATVITLQEVMEPKFALVDDIGAEPPHPHEPLYFRTKDFNIEMVHECARPDTRYKVIIIENEADIKMFFKRRILYV